MFIEECNPLLPERQTQQDAEAPHAMHVLLNNAPTRTVSKMKRNNGYLITLHIWMPELSCLGSDTRSYFETFIWSPKQFL